MNIAGARLVPASRLASTYCRRERSIGQLDGKCSTLSFPTTASKRIVGHSEVGPLLLPTRPASARDWAGLVRDSALHHDCRNC
jgi:hypothetical protein